MTRRIFLALFGQSPVLGPMLWSDCGNPTPPRMLLTFQEFEDTSAILRSKQTPENTTAIEKACGVLRMAVGQPFGA